MKTPLKQLAATILVLLAAATTVEARPIVLPDAAATASESGTFAVNDKSQIILTGSPISLSTSLPSDGSDVANGSAKFASGDLQYKDGAASLDGQMARVSFGKQVTAGQVVYIIKGLVYGNLVEGGQTMEVNGNFSVVTKPAPEGTKLQQAQVESAHVMVTPRSTINK